MNEPMTYTSQKNPELVQRLQEAVLESMEEIRVISMVFEYEGRTLEREESAGLRRMLDRIADRLDEALKPLPI